MRPLILASASPARLRLLRQAGLDPHVVVSGVDEEWLQAQWPGAAPREVADRLAQAKARQVASDPGLPAGALVLGCDSVFEFAGEALGKPRDPADAVTRMSAMSDGSGTLWTGHWLVDVAGGREVGEVVGTTVRFARLTRAEIEAYVATGEPLGVAGGFTLDGIGSAFIAAVDGDPGSVIGVSVPALRRLVLDLGMEWRSLYE